MGDSGEPECELCEGRDLVKEGGLGLTAFLLADCMNKHFLHSTHAALSSPSLPQSLSLRVQYGVGEAWPVPMRELPSGMAAIDSGPCAQPMWGNASFVERPVSVSTALTLGGAGGREMAEGKQSFQVVKETQCLLLQAGAGGQTEDDSVSTKACYSNQKSPSSGAWVVSWLGDCLWLKS